MMFRILFIITLVFNFSVFGDTLFPNPNIKPYNVVEIQLNALMKNDTPFKDAGIEQTWEFAHPQNRQYTGPLSNFKLMMKAGNYSLMLKHSNHKIIVVSEDDNIANYFVELVDKLDNKFGFTWTVSKVLAEGKYKNCWMTTAVSRPMPLAKST